MAPGRLKSERDALVLSELRIADEETRRLRRQWPRFDHEDVRAEAVLAIVEAARLWKADQGVPFGVYARLAVRNRFKVYVAAQYRIVAAPRAIGTILGHAKSAEARIRVEATAPLTDEEVEAQVAREVGVTVERLRRLRHHMRLVDTSTDAPSRYDPNEALGDSFVCSAERAESAVPRSIDFRRVVAATTDYISALPTSRQRCAMGMRVAGATLDDIARAEGITREGARQVLVKAMPGLRAALDRRLGREVREALRHG